jgi:transcriptional regulator with XRE-family HTH domain
VFHTEKPPHSQAHFIFLVPQKIKRACLFPPLELEITKYLLYLSNNDKSKYSSQMKQSFGEYIRHLRTKNELTLTQLGAKLDLDSANLSKIENGKRDFDEKRLTLLAQVFDLNLEELKTEFFSDLFAKKLYESSSSTDALFVAEKKVKYLRQINAKQESLKL